MREEVLALKSPNKLIEKYQEFLEDPEIDAIGCSWHQRIYSNEGEGLSEKALDWDF